MAETYKTVEKQRNTYRGLLLRLINDLQNIAKEDRTTLEQNMLDKMLEVIEK